LFWCAFRAHLEIRFGRIWKFCAGFALGRRSNRGRCGFQRPARPPQSWKRALQHHKSSARSPGPMSGAIAQSPSASRCRTTTSTTMSQNFWTMSCRPSARRGGCQAGPGRQKRSNGGKQRLGKNDVGWQSVRQRHRLYD